MSVRYLEQLHCEPEGSYMGLAWLAEQKALSLRDDSKGGIKRYVGMRVRFAILDYRRKFRGWRRAAKTLSIEAPIKCNRTQPFDDTVEWLLRPCGLPTEARTALMMKRDGHRGKDIAKALGVSETQASKHLRNGRRILAARYASLTGIVLDTESRIPETYRVKKGASNETR